MEFLKYFKEDTREPFMDHPKGIQLCLQELLGRQVEFQLKVDKAHTIPYTVSVDKVGGDFCVLAFQRPLPHELLPGALFVGGFNMDGHAFETRMRFQERAAYLRYRFALPDRVSKVERRHFTRLPFRPREKAHVTLRDGGVPGLGVSGPLLNLGKDGLAMRVDRIIRLDTGLRLPLSASHFPAKKFFSSVRLEELPGVPVLDLRGFAIHATEKSGILMLGLTFQEPAAEAARLLADTLALRTKLLTAKPPAGVPASTPGPGPKGAPAPHPAATPHHVDAPAAWDAPDVLNEGLPEDTGTEAELDPLVLLQRRTLPILVLSPDETRAAEVGAALEARGYRRLQFALQAPPKLGGLVVVDAHPGAEPGPDHALAHGTDWESGAFAFLDQRARALA